MPELPEVETIRRDLASRLRGRTITRVLICPDPRGCRLLRRYPSRQKFRRGLKGRTITRLGRRAKYLLFHLDSEEILIIHLGMSGRLLLLSPGRPLPDHTRAVFTVSGGDRLCFIDPRKFGEACLFSPAEENPLDPFRLGPEPLAGSFTRERLKKILGRRNAPVKSVLLDQTAIAGLGNIYSDEALFRSRIHPLRKSSTLSPAEAGRLHRAVREVLGEAIRSRGTTAADGQYLDGQGRPGRYQQRLKVYGRKGEACPRCRTPIETHRIGGRTAHFCPRCQPLDSS